MEEPRVLSRNPILVIKSQTNELPPPEDGRRVFLAYFHARAQLPLVGSDYASREDPSSPFAEVFSLQRGSRRVGVNLT